MSDSTNVGQNPVGGQTSDPVDLKANDVVPYSSHRQLLDEKKKLQAELAQQNARLAELEAERKAAEEAKLVADKKWEELAKKKEEEVKQKEIEIKKRDELLYAKQKEREEELKKQRVLEELGTKFKKPHYEKFLNLDEVPDDLEQMKQWVLKFKQENQELLVPTSANPPPNTSPRGKQPETRDPPKTMQDHISRLNEYNRQRFGKKE